MGSLRFSHRIHLRRRPRARGVVRSIAHFQSLDAEHGLIRQRLVDAPTGLRYDRGSIHLTLMLHRMEEREWIAAEWGVSPRGRRAKFYRLTPAGRKQLLAETNEWTDYVAAVTKVLRSTTQPA
ncbi:MAG TPA: helix-turn-helix transcriptional regulator [Gemmatimonadaceae bacterium]